MGKNVGKAGKKILQATNADSLDRSRASMQKVTGGSVVQILANQQPEHKISYALQKLLAMESSPGMSVPELQQILNGIVVAWNLSLHDAALQPKIMQDYIAEIAKGVTDPPVREVESLIKRLIITKQIFFLDDKRIVATYEVKRVGPKLFVSASTVMPPTKSNAAIATPD